MVFDSLSTAEHSRTIAKFRDYLNCEYAAKVDSTNGSVFDSINLPGHSVSVPHQYNTSDCGLYVLQYVEQFFKVLFEVFSMPFFKIRLCLTND